MLSDFETLVEVVRANLADDTIEFGIFRLANSEQSSERRVVWIPTEFTNSPVLVANALRDADTDEYGDTLFTDFQVVECHISGRDFYDACLIRRLICNAVRQSFATSSIPMGGAYETEKEGNSSVMWGGRVKIIQMFQWQINMPKLDGYSQIVNTIEDQGALQSPDGSHETDETLLTMTTDLP